MPYWEKKTKNAYYLAGALIAREKLGGVPGALISTGVGAAGGAIASDPGQRVSGALMGGALGAGVGAAGGAALNRLGMGDKARKMMGNFGRQSADAATPPPPQGSPETQKMISEILADPPPSANKAPTVPQEKEPELLFRASDWM